MHYSKAVSTAFSAGAKYRRWILLLGIALTFHQSVWAATTSASAVTCETMVTLSPALAQVVTDLIGVESSQVRLRGVSAFSPLPQKLKIPELATAGRIDIEKVLSIRPDCIFYAPGVFSRENVSRLSRAIASSKLRLSMISVPMDSLSEISSAYRIIGAHLKVEARGARVALEFERRLKELRDRLKGLRVLIQVDSDPIIVVGGANTFLSESFSHLGLVNVFATIKEPYPRVSAESALASAPDRILILGEPENEPRYQAIASEWKKRFPSLKAVRNNGVRVILSRELTLPTRSLVDGLQRVVNDEVQ